MTIESDIALIQRLADEAAEVVKPFFRQPLAVEDKADHSPVTAADRAVEAAIRRMLERDRPEDGIFGEEYGAASGRSARLWVIDPIDGTRNYARALPMFSVSVGLMEAGFPVVGLIYNPMTGQMYSASRDGGAWLDDERIETPESPPTGELFIGLPSGREEILPPPVHRWIDRMVLRATGSTALNLALLASGALDAVFCSKCRLWDMAAGALIVEEAKASVTDHDGHPYFPIDLAAYHSDITPFMAARPDLLVRLLAELRDDRQ